MSFNTLVSLNRNICVVTSTHEPWIQFKNVIMIICIIISVRGFKVFHHYHRNIAWLLVSIHNRHWNNRLLVAYPTSKSTHKTNEFSEGKKNYRNEAIAFLCGAKWFCVLEFYIMSVCLCAVSFCPLFEIQFDFTLLSNHSLSTKM